MSTAAALLLGLAIGLPVTLLAAAVLHHARTLAAAAARAAAPAELAWPDAAVETELAWDEPAWGAQDWAEALDAAPAAPFTEQLHAAAAALPSDPALDRLERTVGELQSQLTRQTGALAELLSERLAAPRAAASPAAPEADAAPAAPPPASRPAAAKPAVAQHHAAPDAAHPLRERVDARAAEGLSERAIARRLRIGLEEVRLLRDPQERAS